MAGFSASPAIATDRPCHKCGYNLRGLASGGRCPECGVTIRRPRGLRGGDSLTDAPLAYLKALASGLLLMAACAVGGVIALGYARGGGLYGASWAVVICSAWWVGVWTASRRRPMTDETVPDPLLDSPRFRVVVRVSQLAWPAVALAWAAAAYIAAATTPAVPPLGPAPGVPPPPPALIGLARRSAMILEALGFISVVPLSVYLSALSDWAGETGLAERFRMSAWGITAGGLGAVLVSAFAVLAGSAGPLSLGSVTLLLGLAMVAQALFIISLVQLAYSAIWAISNAHTRIVVDDRIAERRAREAHVLSERVSTADQAMHAARAKPAAPGPANQPRVARPRGGAEPYALEPDEGDAL